MDESQHSISYNQIMNMSSNGNAIKNTQISEKDISAFEEDPMHNFSSKSELKNLISLKKKGSSFGAGK